MSSNGKKNKEAALLAEEQKQKLAEELKKKKAKERNAKLKPVIITAAAVIAAAALILCGYFLWFKPNHINGKKITSGGGSDTKLDYGTAARLSAEHTYKTVEYNGFTLPENVAEILKAGDEDTATACEKYGTAMDIGGIPVSVPDFEREYIEFYFQSVNDTSYQNKLTVDSDPAEQIFSEGVTWKDKLSSLATEYLTQTVLLFKEAMENGVTLTDEEALSIEQNRNIIENNAKNEGVSADEFLATTYTEGMTLGIYMRHFIFSTYATKYCNLKNTAQVNSYSEKETDDYYQAHRDDYDYVDVRIFSMKADDESGKQRALKQVKSLDTFFDFAIDYYKNSKINYTKELCEIETLWLRSRKSSFNQKIGTQIGDWCFAEGRKAGDVTVIDGPQLKYLIYMVRPRYMNYTVDLYQAEWEYDPETLTKVPTAEQEEQAKTKAQTAFDEFNATKKTGEDFNTVMAKHINGTDFFFKNTRCLDINRSVVEWAYDKDRKPGDYTMLEIGTGYGVYMFEGSNKDDLDYVYYVHSDLAEQDFNKYYESVCALNGNEVTKYSAAYNKAVDLAEAYCAEYSAGYREYQAQQTTEGAQ